MTSQSIRRIVDSGAFGQHELVDLLSVRSTEEAVISGINGDLESSEVGNHRLFGEGLVVRGYTGPHY